MGKDHRLVPEVMGRAFHGPCLKVLFTEKFKKNKWRVSGCITWQNLSTVQRSRKSKSQAEKLVASSSERQLC